MTAYYNEHDPFAAAWLRELIRMGRIAPGVVDERSIEDIVPADLEGYTQCHFFAGIGVWSYALRRAGWPDDRPVWTGSCPCQPFSAAGKAGRFTDERHLWPHWFHLIQHGKPETVPVFGEQVASKDGLGWLDLVQTDLEGAGYACGAVDLCAAGVGAPHIRQRLFFVAERLAYTGSAGLPEQRRERDEPEGFTETDVVSWLADTEGARGCGRGSLQNGADNQHGGSNPLELDGRPRPTDAQPSPTNGLWADADWLYCRDGKWRPVEPGTFPLVDGLTKGVVPSRRIGMEIDANKTAEARVMRLKGYGNAINAEIATAFIEAYILTTRA